MSRKKTTPRRPPPKPQKSILQEAWDNMSRDFGRFLPEKLRERQDKKKFVLWLLILELVVLGVIGKLVYEWLTGG